MCTPIFTIKKFDCLQSPLQKNSIVSLHKIINKKNKNKNKNYLIEFNSSIPSCIPYNDLLEHFSPKISLFIHNSKDFLWFPSTVYSSMILSKLSSFISSKVLETSLFFLSLASLRISLSNRIRFSHSLQNHAHLISSPPHASHAH